MAFLDVFKLFNQCVERVVHPLELYYQAVELIAEYLVDRDAMRVPAIAQLQPTPG